MENFLTIQLQHLVELISKATKAVIYVSPGINEQVAKALLATKNRLGSDRVLAVIDPKPQEIRLGYGHLNGLRLLKKEDIKTHTVRDLRIGFFRADDLPFVFAPISAILENEKDENPTINAIQISKEESERILRSFGLEAIELFNSNENNIEIPLISESPLTEFEVRRAEQDLEKNPPIAPDLTRKLRILNSRFQFVEIKFKGSKLSQRKLSLKSSDLGFNLEEVRDNLSGTWKIIGPGIKEEMISLEGKLKSIKEQYLYKLPGFGQIILGEQRPPFDKEMNAFEISVKEKCKLVKSKVDDYLKDSKERLKKLLVNNYLKTPPLEIRKMNLSSDLLEKQIINWVEDLLVKRYPTVDAILDEVEIDWKIFNISEQILNKEGFSEAVRKVFSLDVDDLVKTEEAIALKPSDNEDSNRDK